MNKPDAEQKPPARTELDDPAVQAAMVYKPHGFVDADQKWRTIYAENMAAIHAEQRRGRQIMLDAIYWDRLPWWRKLIARWKEKREGHHRR